MSIRAHRAAAAAIGLLLAAGAAAGSRAAGPDSEAPPPAEAPPAEAPAAEEPAGGPAAGPDDPAQGRQLFGMIRGTIFDAKRRPMAGLMVQLASRGERGLLRVTGSDERGEYVFSDLPAGVYDVELAVDGRSQRKESIAVRPPFRNIVDFQLGATDSGARRALPPGPGAPAGAPPASDPRAAEPVAVRGRFLDMRKHAIPEVSVTLVGLNGGGTFQEFSADDGTFVIEAVPPGPYRVLVASPGHVALELKSVEVAPVRGLNLGLSLVDYPLNFKDRRGETPPREEARAVP